MAFREAQLDKDLLIAVVKKGKLEKFSAFLRLGEDPNSRDAYDSTLLHWYCYLDKKCDIIKELLKAGERIYAIYIDGWIP